MSDQMTQKARDRHEAFMSIINYLNEQDEQGTRHLYDCRNLGFALIYRHKHGWEVEWFYAKKLPGATYSRMDTFNEAILRELYDIGNEFYSMSTAK